MLHRALRFPWQVTNTGGTALEVTYVIIFWCYCNKDTRATFLRQLAATALLCGAGIVVALAVHHCPKDETCNKPFHHGTPQNVSANILGVVANVGNICLYGAPLAIMREVMRTESVKFMPFLLTLTVFSSSIMWLSYGLYVGDLFITIPNASGVLFGTAQLVFYFYWWRRERGRAADDEAKAGLLGNDGADEEAGSDAYGALAANNVVAGF